VQLRRGQDVSCTAESDTALLSACGQTKRPRSRRLANRHSPSPSNHKSFTMSPRRPRKTNRCPQNGLCASVVCTSAESPSKPFLMSVTPAASQIRVPAGSVIIDSARGRPGRRAAPRH
jgi:hypothetical protein